MDHVQSEIWLHTPTYIPLKFCCTFMFKNLDCSKSFQQATPPYCYVLKRGAALVYLIHNTLIYVLKIECCYKTKNSINSIKM